MSTNSLNETNGAINSLKSHFSRHLGSVVILSFFVLIRKQNWLVPMASAPPSVASTKETTNFARLCRLLVDVGSQALRDKFDSIHAPGNLHTVLATSKTTIQWLRKKRIVNPMQWNKLYPVVASSLSSAHFDITLIVVLLRNICGLKTPVTGWDKLPSHGDISCEADIVRVKYFRNTIYGHAEKASVDDVTFQQYWHDIREALVRLGGAQYAKAIDTLKTESMDPELENEFVDLLKEWKKDDDDIKDRLSEVEMELKKVKVQVDALVPAKEGQFCFMIYGVRINYRNDPHFCSCRPRNDPQGIREWQLNMGLWIAQ